jgi:hypothetical protein
MTPASRDRAGGYSEDNRPYDSSDSRLPSPRDIGAEKAVLGSILIDRDALREVADNLSPEDFCQPEHVHIYGAMRGLLARGEPIDVVTVASELARIGSVEVSGGSAYLARLGNETPMAIHVKQYAQAVVDRSTEREFIQAAGRISQLAYDHDPDLALRASDVLAGIRGSARYGDPIGRLGAALLSSFPILPVKPPLLGRLDPVGATLLYGPGGIGKGTLAASWIALLVAAGHRVLLLDYEHHPEEWAPRIHGLGGLAATDGVLYVPTGGPEWHGRRGPLWVQAPELREAADSFRATFVIVDSIVTGCDNADVLKAEIATQYFGGLQIIGRPSLSIGHVTKISDLMHPFGSVFIHNLARATWSLQVAKGGALLVNRKANRYHNLGRFMVTAEWRDGQPIAVHETSYLATIADRVAEALAGDPLTEEQIVARLSRDDGEEVKANSVSAALNRGAKKKPPRFQKSGDHWEVAR